MAYYYDIPDHPNKHKVDLPFDVDMYIEDKYEDVLEKLSKMYNETCLEEQVTKYKKELENEKNLYLKWFSFFIDKLRNKESSIQIAMYGPNVDRSKTEGVMMDNALKNFYYVLLSKGYMYNERDEKRSFIDALDGWGMECTKIIRIY